MSRRATFKFRLYVAGGAENSVLAISNLNALCRTRLAGRFEIEIVDVFREPKRALADAIFMTPTLVKLGPAPAVKIVGTLNNMQPLLVALDLIDQAA
jgi:circadian clock protein KaiB